MLPTQQSLQKNRSLWFLKPHINAPDLFHLNRRSIAGAVAIGFGLAWIPFPVQMVSASILAVIFRRNLAVAIFSTLITNPLTMAPMYFFAYWMGSKILRLPVLDVLNPQIYQSFSNFINSVGTIWQPLLLGCVIAGSMSSVIGFYSVKLIGRLIVLNKIKQRKLRQSQKEDKNN